MRQIIHQVGQTLTEKTPCAGPAAAQYIMHGNPAECTATRFIGNRLTGVYIKPRPVWAGPQHRLDTWLSLDAWDSELSDWEKCLCSSGEAWSLPTNVHVIVQAWMVEASSQTHVCTSLCTLLGKASPPPYLSVDSKYKGRDLFLVSGVKTSWSVQKEKLEQQSFWCIHDNIHVWSIASYLHVFCPWSSFGHSLVHPSYSCPHSLPSLSLYIPYQGEE